MIIIIAPIVTLVNSIKYSHEKSAYDNEVKQVIENNRRIDAKNKNISQQTAIRKKKLMLEYQAIQDSYDKTVNLLNQYYDLNIIYRKYRDMPYIASFIEYFESGRCSSFEGHEGAYNLLEDDIKYNNMMCKMDIIIDNLSLIASYQYLLYNGIQECNSNISQISGHIINSANEIKAEIAAGNDALNNRLASNEYISSIISSNVQYLSDLETFKVLLK